MALTLTTPNTLLGAVAPKADMAKLASGLATVVVGSLFIAMCSKISVPVWPVPVTLQTLAVAMVAAAFGARAGVATLVLYIVEGLSGLPVFAAGGGPQYLLMPDFGFILGFLPMAYVIGRAADAGLSRQVLQMLAMMLLGDVACFAIGYAWLAVALNLLTGMPLSSAFATSFAKGVQPFLVWDVLKMAFAAISVAGIWTLVPRKR